MEVQFFMSKYSKKVKERAISLFEKELSFFRIAKKLTIFESTVKICYTSLTLVIIRTIKLVNKYFQKTLKVMLFKLGGKISYSLKKHQNYLV